MPCSHYGKCCLCPGRLKKAADNSLAVSSQRFPGNRRGGQGRQDLSDGKCQFRQVWGVRRARLGGGRQARGRGGWRQLGSAHRPPQVLPWLVDREAGFRNEGAAARCWGLERWGGDGGHGHTGARGGAELPAWPADGHIVSEATGPASPQSRASGDETPAGLQTSLGGRRRSGRNRVPRPGPWRTG